MMEDQVQTLFGVPVPLVVHPSEPTSSQHSSHHVRTPTRKNEPCSWLHRHQPSLQISQLFLVLILFTCCISGSSANSFFIDEQMVESPRVEALESTFARLARSGTILVDQSPPPVPVGEWNQNAVPDAAEDLRRRAESSSSSTASSRSSSSATTTLKTSTSATASASTTASIAVASSTSTSDLPMPFDLGFSGNITSNCQSFMNSMLSNTTFKTCLPFSLLLQVRHHCITPLAITNLFRTPIPCSKSKNPSFALHKHLTILALQTSRFARRSCHPLPPT